ncbi:hypothetical protein EVAR_52984_1 [Eumeta japonica]|uniref:Uncharacterized protein n=1 Tax=Eumeta variegata TaxID=151549 RepID=A0A4C1Z9N9_EUMVA|nr:hypothetical protein EVAR_52984_1 [Eumeta japonica]
MRRDVISLRKASKSGWPDTTGVFFFLMEIPLTLSTPKVIHDTAHLERSEPAERTGLELELLKFLYAAHCLFRPNSSVRREERGFRYSPCVRERPAPDRASLSA